MLYKWYITELHSREKCLDKRGKSKLSVHCLYYGSMDRAQTHHDYGTTIKDWDAKGRAGPNCMDLPALQWWFPWSHLFCLYLFTSCTRWQSPLLTGAPRNSGVFTPALTSTNEWMDGSFCSDQCRYMNLDALSQVVYGHPPLATFYDNQVGQKRGQSGSSLVDDRSQLVRCELVWLRKHMEAKGRLTLSFPIIIMNKQSQISFHYSINSHDVEHIAIS